MNASKGIVENGEDYLAQTYLRVHKNLLLLFK